MSVLGSWTRARSTALLVAALSSTSLIVTGLADAHATAGSAAIAATQDLVTLTGPQQARSKPSARAGALGVVPARTPITAERTTLPVLGTYGAWLLVRLPGRPNGHTGWISERGTRSSVTAWHLVIDTAARRVAVYHAGRLVREMKAVVGKAATPTPTGRLLRRGVDRAVACRDRRAVRARAERALDRLPGVRRRSRPDRAARPRERGRRSRNGRLTRLRTAG